MDASAAHRRRFAKWQNLAPPQTRHLRTAVNTEFVPLLEEVGFSRVGVTLRHPDWPVSGKDIALEREVEGATDSVTVSFEKYATPRLQIHLSRRESSAPHSFIRSGNLVARKRQYYHFWGKPWWLPTGLWPKGQSQRTVRTLQRCVGQILAFLEMGALGPNVSDRASRIMRAAQQGAAADREEPRSDHRQ